MDKYSLSMRVFHWLLAIFIIGALCVGFWMTNLPNDYAGKFDLYNLHKSFGIVVFVLVLFRMINRIFSAIPLLPLEINVYDKKLSECTIFVLYVCMILMPLSGYLMSSYGGYAIKILDYNVPQFVAQDFKWSKFFYQVHQITAWLLVGLITLHILGTLKHLAFQKVNLLKRMW